MIEEPPARRLYGGEATSGCEEPITILMSSTISRADLIRLDAQDGAVDGTVTQSQLIDFDQQFSEEVLQKDLFDSKGRLDYGGYLDNFAKGWSVWKGFVENPESITLIDALKLGQKTGEIKEKGHVGFRTKNGKREEALRHVKNGQDLFYEWIGNRGEEKGEILIKSFMFFHFLYGIKGGHSPEVVFNTAAGEFLGYLYEEGLLKRGSNLDKEFSERLRTISVYETLSPGQEEEKIWSLSAALAYRSLYFFPAVADRIWSGAVQSVDLTFANLQNNGLFYQIMSLSQNPYAQGDIDAMTEGIYDLSDNHLRLPLHGLDNPRTLSHELAHVLWEKDYPRSFFEWLADRVGNFSEREKLAKIIHFFDLILLKEQYTDIFGTDYGHPDSELRRFSLHYDPVHETHSLLAELAESGPDFPERIRDRLTKKNWSPEEVNEVYSNLSQFREIIKRTWGYEGPPPWTRPLFE